MYRYALYLQLNNGKEGYYDGENSDGIPYIERKQAYGFPSERAAIAKAKRLSDYLDRYYISPRIAYWEVVDWGD